MRGIGRYITSGKYTRVMLDSPPCPYCGQTIELMSNWRIPEPLAKDERQRLPDEWKRACRNTGFVRSSIESRLRDHGSRSECLYLKRKYDEDGNLLPREEQPDWDQAKIKEWMAACYAACVAARPKPKKLTPEELREAHRRGGRNQPIEAKREGGRWQSDEAKRRGGLASAAKRWGHKEVAA